MRIRLVPVFLLFSLVLLSACGSGSSGSTASSGPASSSPAPADTYFALAVTDNSHNHAGARLLFLDFQTAPDATAIRNNVVISPRVGSGAIMLDGAAGDWNPKTGSGLAMKHAHHSRAERVQYHQGSGEHGQATTT